LAYAGDALRGSSGFNASLIPEEKFDGKRTRGRPRRTWIDDVIRWTQKKSMMKLRDWLRTGTLGER